MNRICHGQSKVLTKLMIATSVLIIPTTILIVGTWWLLRDRRNEPEAMSHVQKVLQLTNVGDFAFEDETLLWRKNGSAVSAPARASEKNQAMDRLMARRDMAPDDFSALMRRLHADGKQDELTRNFAVQHLGLYVQRRIRLGEYDPKSREALEIRSTLEAAADETHSTVAGPAFKALAELAVVDPAVVEGGLDARLVALLRRPEGWPPYRGGRIGGALGERALPRGESADGDAATLVERAASPFGGEGTRWQRVLLKGASVVQRHAPETRRPPRA